MITIIFSLIILLIIGFFFKNKIAIKLVNLFNSKANSVLDKTIDKSELLNLKVQDLDKKKIGIIKSVSKMKANQLRNEANIKEIEESIVSYTILAKKYKEENKKDECVKILTRLHIKENELVNLTKTNEELKLYIVEGEKQLEIFKNKIIGIQSKSAIIENKKTNAEALSSLSSLNEGDEGIEKLINDANIDYDTTKIASETLLEENSIDFDIQQVNIEELYVKL